MKIISATVRELAEAFALAASLCDRQMRKQRAGLESIGLSSGDGGQLKVTASIFDFSLVLSVPAAVDDFPTIAVSGGRLAGVVGGFADDAMVEISVEGSVARVCCKRSKFKLPLISNDQIPASLVLAPDTEKGRTELCREQALRLFARTLFAVEASETRPYLRGILLRDTDDGLAAVTTDGHRLVRVATPSTAGLSTDQSLIVPVTAAKIVIKLLGDRSVERVTLRRSNSLFEIADERFVFTSKLVDSAFPDISRVIPTASQNAVIVDRSELAHAITRVKAVAGQDSKAPPLVGLQWAAGDSVLHLALAGWDMADDVIEATAVSGAGRVAVNADLFAEQIDQFEGDKVCIDVDGGQARHGQPTPLLILNPGDPTYTGLLSPCAWPLDRSKAA